jgi:hypothetical protein
VDISGSRIIAGGDGSNGAFHGSGSAYIFERTTSTNWDQSAELNFAFNPQQQLANGFGWGVATSGETALVGAWREQVDRGTAYSFNLTAHVPEPTALLILAPTIVMIRIQRARRCCQNCGGLDLFSRSPKRESGDRARSARSTNDCALIAACEPPLQSGKSVSTV